MRARARLQLACFNEGRCPAGLRDGQPHPTHPSRFALARRKRQARPSNLVSLYSTPTARQRPAAHLARRSGEAGLQEAVVGRHHVGGTGPAGPHRPAGCSCPSAQAAPRQIFWRTLIAQQSRRSSGAASTAPPASPAEPDRAKKTSRYIRWSERLRRVVGIEILCTKCKAPLCLIALIKSEDTAKKILTAMHLPTEARACPPRPCHTRLRRARRQLHPVRPPPGSPGVEGGEEQAGESWLN